MNPTAAQIASGAAAIRALWVTSDAAPTDDEVAAAVLRTVHARAIAMDALERTRPMIGGPA